MSCPDWSHLTAHRRGDASEPEGWSEALSHLDGCTACRDEATAADPTLVFRRLPPVETGADEIAAMRAGVAALRRAGRVTEPSRAARGGSSLGTKAFGGRSSAWWGRAAAAAVLAAGLLTLQPGLGERTTAPGGTALVFDGGFDRGLREMPPVAWLGDTAVSAVDDIENPAASVYHFDDEELAVVMVVDPGLDV